MNIARRQISMWLRFGVASSIAAIGGLAAATANGSTLEVPADGWVSWSVPAVAKAPAWCCFHWDGGSKAAGGRCNLDSRNGGYGSRDADAPVETMRIYARLDEGTLEQVRALAPSCPVDSKTAIADLGAVSADDSVRWLERHMGSVEERSTDLLAAIAVHAGPVARDALVTVARSGNTQDARKDAVFWMGQVRASDSASMLTAIMFEDADSAVREHAAFALSQSEIPDAETALIRLGNTDREPEVRAKAWFWLAQTGAPGTEAAIAKALSRESDQDVREQAIFALSQLPDDRAVDALGALLDDPARSQEDRKRALFWLGQSDSPRAHDYLARILAGR